MLAEWFKMVEEENEEEVISFYTMIVKVISFYTMIVIDIDFKNVESI